MWKSVVELQTWFFCSDVSISSDIFRISALQAVAGSHVNHDYLTSMYFFIFPAPHISLVMWQLNCAGTEVCRAKERGHGLRKKPSKKTVSSNAS